MLTKRLVAMEVQMRSMEEGRVNQLDSQVHPSADVLQYSKAPTSCGLLSAGTLILRRLMHLSSVQVSSKRNFGRSFCYAFTNCMVPLGYSLYDTENRFLSTCRLLLPVSFFTNGRRSVLLLTYTASSWKEGQPCEP